MSLLSNGFKMSKRAAGGVLLHGLASRRFSGAYATVPATLDADLSTSQITAMAWVKLVAQSVGENNAAPIMCGIYSGGGSTVGFSLGESGGTEEWQSGHFNGSWKNTPVASPTLGVWTHVAATFDSAIGIDQYINNAVTGSYSGSLGNLTRGADWRIGRRWDSPQFINAYIADLRVFPGILPTEIDRAYNGLDPSATPGGWWFLNSDDLLDHSGNGNHATDFGTLYSIDGPLD